MTEDQIRVDERLCLTLDVVHDLAETKQVYLYPFAQSKLRQAVKLIEEAKQEITKANT